MKARYFLPAAAIFGLCGLCLSWCVGLCVVSASAQQLKRPPREGINQGGAEALLMSKVEPDYPEAVKNKGTAGQIVIAFVIGRDGSVFNVRPVAAGLFGCKSLNSEDPDLRQAAIAAVKQWRFVPLRRMTYPEIREKPLRPRPPWPCRSIFASPARRRTQARHPARRRAWVRVIGARTVHQPQNFPPRSTPRGPNSGGP